MLLARYIFDDPNNFNKDYSGNTTGVIGGTLKKSTITPPGFVSCAHFNGSSYVQIGRKAMPTKQITVSAWAYSSNWNSYNSTIMSCADSGGWDIWRTGNNKLSFECYFDKGIGYRVAEDDTALSSLSAGWHLFVGTYSNGYLKFYRDGKLRSTKGTGRTDNLIQYNPSNYCFIGAEASGTSASGPMFNGEISDVRIYSEALSDSQIKYMYENPNSLTFKKGGELITSGQILENKSTVDIKKTGDINCYEIIEAPIFTSSSTYSPEQCYNYCTRDGAVRWNSAEIKESKGTGWRIGNIICLVIPCSNKKTYISYQRIQDTDYLTPLKVYQIQDGSSPFIYIEKTTKKIYCHNLVEA